MTESAWQAMVVELMGYTGWRYYHTWSSIRSAAGFPDLVALHPDSGDRLVAELKTDTGKATAEQLQWLTWFEACGIDAYLWRPEQLEEVRARLQRHPRIVAVPHANFPAPAIEPDATLL